MIENIIRAEPWIAPNQAFLRKDLELLKHIYVGRTGFLPDGSRVTG